MPFEAEAIKHVGYSISGFIFSVLFTSFIVSRTNHPKVFHAETVVN